MVRRLGFTLIELLVVISVIAILMAILMPALSRVKTQAQLTVCRNNLRNYGLTGRMYSDDYDGEFPYSFEWLYAKDARAACLWHDENKNLDRHPELAGCLWPYLKGQEINLCPQFNNVAREMGCPNCGKGGAIALKPQYGYTMNSYLNGDGFDSVPTQHRTAISKLKLENHVKDPARTFYFGEENTWAIPGFSIAGINDNNLRAVPSGNADCFATFHKTRASERNEGVSFAVFVDSHVEEVSPYPPADNPDAPKGNTWQLSWPGRKPAPLF
ncbi:MAG: type II secretion system protein [Phycisphaerales bacterium]